VLSRGHSASLFSGLLCSPISINSASEYGYWGSILVIFSSGIARAAHEEAALGLLTTPAHCVHPGSQKNERRSEGEISN
jgi:hypothetical protein